MQRHVALSAAVGCVAIGLLAALPRVAQAASYASAITETAGTVSYTLNEGATVTIIRDGVPDAPVTATKGVNTFARNGAGNYQILVTTAGTTGGYQDMQSSTLAAPLGSINGQPAGTALSGVHQLSDDTQLSSRFSNPHGVAVNSNPANGALFGRIYVSNSSAGTVTVGASTRNTGDGLYALNPDMTDAIGQGDTAVAGIFTDIWSRSSNAPWHLSLDADGAVYVTDQVDAAEGVKRFAPDLSSSSNVLIGTPAATGNPSGPYAPTATFNHGSVYGGALTGGVSTGNLTLYTIDEDLSPAGTTDQMSSLWRYDLGSNVTDNATLPTQLNHFNQHGAINGVATDLARSATSGKFYMLTYRSPATTGGADYPGLIVASADGQTKLFDSLAETKNIGLDADTSTGTQDVLRGIRALDVSPDEHTMAAMTNDAQILVVPLIDGIPDIANRSLLYNGNSFTNAGWDVTYDAAGNIYGVSTNGTYKAVREYSPGTISQTVYGSNGTFKTITEQSFNGSGSLGDSSHWLLGSVASGNDAVMSIGNLTGGDQTITSDSASNAARIRFSGGNYTIGGSGTITMGAGALEPRIIAESGNQTITAPISIMTKPGSTSSYQGFGVAAYAGATLTLTNVSYQNFGFYKITKWSDGTVVMPTFLEGKLDIKGGTLRFSTPSTGTGAYTNALQIAGTPTAPTATLDLGASGIVYDYPTPTGTGTSPLANITNLVKSGYNGGTWTGKGITSQRAANDGRYGIGILDVASLNLPVDSNGNLVTPLSYLNGVPVIDPSNIVLVVTLKGDSDISGTVNFTDLLTLAKHYGTADGSASWTTGDTNYDGNVNFTDLLSLAKNYNQSLSADQASELGSSFTTDFALAQALAPEPASLSAVLGVGALALRRRRGNSR